MIKNIVLDMGNVLLNFDPEVSLQKFCSCEESRSLIRRELFGGIEWSLGDLGLVDSDGRFERVSKRIPEKWLEELKMCVYHWDICMTPLPGVKEFLQRVKSDGYALYVLSNADTSFYDYFPKALPMDLFDGIVVSCDIHAIKPDLRMYQHLLQTYHLEPDTCVFADDTHTNAAGSVAAGMHGYVFRGDYDALYRYIQELNRQA